MLSKEKIIDNHLLVLSAFGLSVNDEDCFLYHNMITPNKSALACYSTESLTVDHNVVDL
jgi:hypothetical protein